jgi:hypothetical protein
VTDHSDNDTNAAGTAEPPEQGATPESPDANRESRRAPPRGMPRPAPTDPYREALRERLREPMRGPLRDMFRDAGYEPPRESRPPAQPADTPAAQFAPVTPPPAPPQTVVVRQPVVLALVIVGAILGLVGAGLLGWQLYLLQGQIHLLQGQMDHLTTTVAQSGRVADAVSRLSDAATQANEIADQALVNATRPWIGVDTVQSGPITANEPLNVTVRVRNSGRTPSIDMQGLFLVYISPINSPPAELTDPCASCVRSVVLPNGIVSYKLAVRASVMTPDEVQRIKGGKDTMWIVGRLDYHDGEGELHTTNSCLYYRASAIAGFTSCDDGNSAD